MIRRDYLEWMAAVMGCAGYGKLKPGDLQEKMYSEINKLRKQNGKSELTVDSELEAEAETRAAEFSLDEDRVTEIGHDKPVSDEVKAQMVVKSWLEVNDLHNIVLNTEIENFGIGIDSTNDRHNIALKVE